MVNVVNRRLTLDLEVCMNLSVVPLSGRYMRCQDVSNNVDKSDTTAEVVLFYRDARRWMCELALLICSFGCA